MSERIGIAGGGAIASGLACVAAEHGQVVLWARRPDAATAKVEQLIERRGGVGAGNVSVSDDLDALRDATFVVEAIAEEQDAKAALLRDLGGAATNGTILATTTSALSVTALADATGRPERFVGLHVFNPVPKMDLVELVFPAAADDETRERTRALCAALGKTRGRGPRHARLRRQPPAVPVPVRRRRAARGERAGAAGDRRLHAHGRRPPDGTARAARLRRPRRVGRDRPLDRRRGARRASRR